jgi:hypothetical protein
VFEWRKVRKTKRDKGKKVRKARVRGIGLALSPCGTHARRLASWAELDPVGKIFFSFFLFVFLSLLLHFSSE